MDIETAKILIPKLEALRAFINNVAKAGSYLPDNQTRANYRAIYEDINATINDPNLAIYAPPLPHLGTTSDDSTLWGKHQMLILDSGSRLIKYLDSQLILLFPQKCPTPPGKTSKPPQDFPASINIERFQGIFGNVDNSSIAQNLDYIVLKGNFESLSKELLKLGVDQTDINELHTALDSESAIKDQTKFGPKVGAWIGKMVQKAATGAWDISINAVGNILALIIAKYYGF